MTYWFYNDDYLKHTSCIVEYHSLIGSNQIKFTELTNTSDCTSIVDCISIMQFEADNIAW